MVPHPVLEKLSRTKQKVWNEGNNTNRWTKFTYVGLDTKFITKLFKNSSIKISYTTNNTTGKILAARSAHAQTHNRFRKSGVYQLTCPDCNMKYIGQTGRSFRIRFQEHFRDFKYNNRSKFASINRKQTFHRLHGRHHGNITRNQ